MDFDFSGPLEVTVTVFVCDGNKQCALLPASATADRFAAAFRDGAGKASEALTGRTASGAIELPGQSFATAPRERARPPAGTS